MPKSKKLVYVPGEILDEVMKICRKRGESISKFIEDALKHAVKVEDLGYSLEKAFETLEVIKAQKVLGGVFVPQEVLNFMVGSAYKVGKGELHAKWYESGKLYGKYLKEMFKNPVQALRNFLEATRWDLSGVEATLEGEMVKLRCISTVLTAEGTELLAKFVEGAVNGLGFHVQRVDYVRGIIVVEFK
jgi:hypothetical protein